MITVSIIVRTKDRNLLLRRAIQSILGQTFTEWEIIIVNNGGHQDSLESALTAFKETLSDKIKIVHLKKAELVDAVTNIGIRNGTGKYITLLDDDDTWSPTFLERCISILNKTGVSGVVARTAFCYEKVENDIVSPIVIRDFNGKLKSVNLFKLARCNLFTTNAFIYRRSAFEETGDYREDLHFLGDWEFNIRFVLKHDIKVVPERLAYYHKRVSSGKTASSYDNTPIIDHLYYDKKIRKEYLIKGCRGEIPLYFGLLIYCFMYVNNFVRWMKNALRMEC